MKKRKATPEDVKREKEEIRKRYRSASPDRVRVIPAKEPEDFYKGHGEKRVAIYVRVSTGDVQQTSSFELQKNYYTDMVNRREGWKLVDIYADEGISGTSVRNRKEFQRVYADCKAGKIDLIVTKSVSRFARNIEEFHKYAREFAEMRTPVGVYFEAENKCTLDANDKLSLSLFSVMAENESRTKSNNVTRSVGMRFQGGIYLTPKLLGYDLDKEGRLVINVEEAKTVRLIFYMYLGGYSTGQIAEKLTELKRMNKKGRIQWSSDSILGVLQNERHCGSVLAQKTWTPDCLSHKSRKNRGERRQYETEDHHEAIVSRSEFIAVQRLIANAKYGNKHLPELKVIHEGLLKGFVSIHLRWAGFGAEDYRAASRRVCGDEEFSEPDFFEVKACEGDFDMRGCEVSRPQYYKAVRKLSVFFSPAYIRFSSESIRKLDKAFHVEMLFHPGRRLLAVRPIAKESKNVVKWAKFKADGYESQIIHGMAYLRTLYEMCGWNKKNQYRIRGEYKRQNNERILFFNMRESEIVVPADETESGVADVGTMENQAEEIRPLKVKPKKKVTTFPPEWSENFGKDYYHHTQARELAAMDADADWKISAEGRPHDDAQKLDVAPSIEIERKIRQLISGMERERKKHGKEN